MNPGHRTRVVIVALIAGMAFGCLHGCLTVHLGLSQHVIGIGITLLPPVIYGEGHAYAVPLNGLGKAETVGTLETLWLFRAVRWTRVREELRVGELLHRWLQWCWFVLALLGESLSMLLSLFARKLLPVRCLRLPPVGLP